MWHVLESSPDALERLFEAICRTVLLDEFEDLDDETQVRIGRHEDLLSVGNLTQVTVRDGNGVSVPSEGYA